MATVFFSYSHSDEAYRDQLEKHLSALKHQGVIDTWHDRRVVAGTDFADAIDSNMEAADVVLLLVSSDFLASDYCYRREMTRALELQRAGTTIVIPVILRSCDWRDAPFGKLQATPKDAVPIAKWPDIDEAFLDVVTAIKTALRAHGAQAAAREKTRPAQPAFGGSPAIVRSSNLRVKKEFSDLDRDRFQLEGFEFIAKFFSNSLDELIVRNPELNREFRRIDGNRFTAAVYKNGKKVCTCVIYLSAMPDSIAFSHGESLNSNSFNELLSVAADEQALHFKSMGMSAFDSRERKLTFQGAAEAYWQLFLQPIQPRG